MFCLPSQRIISYPLIILNIKIPLVYLTSGLLSQTKLSGILSVLKNHPFLKHYGNLRFMPLIYDGWFLTKQKIISNLFIYQARKIPGSKSIVNIDNNNSRRA